MKIRRDVLITVVSGVVGVLAGLVVTHIYYLKALDDSKAESMEQRRINQLLLRGIEGVGKIKYDRDTDGNVRGMIIELSGTAKAETSASGSLSVGAGK